jgi:hypothetical protein
MDSLQWLLNISFGILAFLGGWIFTRLFTILDNQEKLLKDINDKTFTDFITLRKEVDELHRKSQQEISDLAIKISTNYITKESYDAYFNKLESKIDRNFELLQEIFIKKNH